MTTLETIHLYAQRLPEPLQEEVLDFVKFMLLKQKRMGNLKKDDAEWSAFSLLSLLTTLQDITDDFSEIDEGLLPLDDITL